MSRKNHKVVDGRLIQTDKRFSALKNKQKEKINGWLFNEYSKIYDKVGLPPDSRWNSQILEAVYSKIEEAEIWIPYYEVEKYFYSRKTKFKNRYEKRLAAQKEAAAKAGSDIHIDMEKLRSDIGQIKGIGEARLNEIMEVISNHLNEASNNEKLKEGSKDV